MDMQEFWFFTCCLPWNLGSSPKSSQVKSFICYYECSFELAQLDLFPYSWEISTRYSHKLHDFSVTIQNCHNDVYVNSFFPCTARFWNFFAIKCFPLIYDLNSFKSRIKRHLSVVGSIYADFMYALIFLCFFFLQLIV